MTGHFTSYEIRTNHELATGCIKVVDTFRDAYDPAFEAVFQKLIDRLEPKVDAAAN